MKFRRMEIEEWFDRYQYEVEYDIGESGVKFFNLGDFDLNARIQLRYGYHRGNPCLRELIIRDYSEMSEENVVVTTGASEANFSIIASLVDSGDHMIIEHPNYPSLYEVPASLGLKFDFLRLDFNEKFRPQLNELEKLVKKNTRLVVLTHPNNPTGSTLTLKELEKVIDLAESNDFYLLLDETYREISYGDSLPPAATLSSNAISVTTMSKAYGLPGIRIGWVVADRRVLEGVVAVREQLSICNSVIGEAIAENVLKRKTPFLKNIRKKVIENLEILETWFNKQSRLEWVPPSGGVVCFPHYSGKTDKLCRILAEKYRTFTVPGYCFGMDEYLRIGFGGEKEELKEGLKRVEEAVKDLERSKQGS